MMRTSAESGESAHRATRIPISRNPPCAAPAVVWTRTRDGKPSRRLTWPRSTHALTASPPRVPVGVVSVTACPASKVEASLENGGGTVGNAERPARRGERLKTTHGKKGRGKRGQEGCRNEARHQAGPAPATR